MSERVFFIPFLCIFSGGKSEVRVKTTEERQLEEIDRLRKETKKKLRRSQQSFHHLAKIQGPMRAIKGSKPPTETKEFNFSKLASGEKHSCGSTGVRAGEVVHPSNFASTLRSKNVTDSCDSSTVSTVVLVNLLLYHSQWKITASYSNWQG